MTGLRAAVIGGGVIGTAVARHLARCVTGARVTLYEKEDRLAAHQTGHNSGVAHAGLYYARVAPLRAAVSLDPTPPATRSPPSIRP